MPHPKATRRQLRRELRIVRNALFRAGAAGVRALAARPGRAAPPLAAVLIAVGAAATGLSGFEVLGEQRARQAALRGEVARLEAEAAALRERIAALRTDPAALELLAKARHELVEPGEVLVMLRFPERVGPPRPDAYSIR